MSGPEFILDSEGYDALPTPFSKALVQDTDSIAALRGWFLALTAKADELRAFTTAYALGGIGAEAAAGKLAYVSIARTWVQERLEVLGAVVPHPPGDPRRIELQRQAKIIRRLKAQVRALGGDPELELPA